MAILHARSISAQAGSASSTARKNSDVLKHAFLRTRNFATGRRLTGVITEKGR